MDIDCFNLESGTLRGHAKSRARGTSHCICWSVSTATKVRRLRQRFEDCDKIAKRGANHGLISSIFRIDETSRGMRGLILRNNKTAFHLLECRFSGNPLYQPGIWTPSRTTSLNGYSVTIAIVSTLDLDTFEDSLRRDQLLFQLYQPGIWTPSRTVREARGGEQRLYQPGIWAPSRTETYRTPFRRGLYQPGIWMSSRTHHPDPTHDAHCINLESGTKTRTRQSYSRCAKRL